MIVFYSACFVACNRVDFKTDSVNVHKTVNLKSEAPPAKQNTKTHTLKMNKSAKNGQYKNTPPYGRIKQFAAKGEFLYQNSLRICILKARNI